MYELTSGTAAQRVAEPTATADLINFGRTIVRRHRLFAAIFFGFVALVLIVTALIPRTYTTHAKLIAGSPGTSTSTASVGPNTNLPVLNALLNSSGVQSAETYAELFQETPVAQQVVSDLNLHMSAPALLSHVEIKPVTNTAILDLAVSWNSAETSAKIANQFAADFVSRERDLIASQATSALAFLSQQMPAAEKRMTAAQTALSQFEATHNIADISAQTQNIISSVSGLDSKIGQVQLDRGQAQAQLASVTSQMAGMKASTVGGTDVAPNPVLAQLNQQEAQLAVQLQTAEQQYTEQHPTVISLKQQLAQVKRQIAQQPATIVSSTNTVPNPVYQQLAQQAAQYRSNVAAADAQLKELAQQRSSYTPRLRELPSETAQLAGLQRNAKLTEDVYTALAQKFNDATVLKTTALSDVTITQPATADAASVKPNWKFNFLVACVLGLLLAGSGIFVADFFDNSFKDERDVERELALPILATVPAFPTNGQATLPWIRSLTIESFLQLVTALRYSSDHQLRTLTITSPLQGDGKSTVALNTAIAMAELEGGVLLIDADLRRPSLHKRIKVQNERGLSDVLVGNASLSTIVHKTPYPGLDVLTSGTPTPNPVKLLQSKRFDEMVEEALRTYRVVIYDAPALNPIIDAGILGAKSEGTVLVVSAGTTDLRAAKKALQKLEGLGVHNILGTVVNRVNASARQYSQYYVSGSNAAIPIAQETAAV